jgi:hypothetical protein
MNLTWGQSLSIYSQALTKDKRTAQTKVVLMMLPKAPQPPAMAG